MPNNSLRKPSPPKSITHIENEHFALWLSSHQPDLRCLAIQHSIFDVLQDMGITKNAILKAALTQISLCCKVNIKRVTPSTKKVHRPKIHCSEKLLHLKKNLYSDKECNTKTKIFDKYRHTIKNKFEKSKFQSKYNNSVNGSQISPDIGELTDEEKIKLLSVEGNIDNDCVITKDPLSVNKAENTTTVVLKRKAKSILNNIEMGAPVEKHKRRSESRDKLKQPQNNNFLDSSKNSSHSYQVSQENKTKLGSYATCNKRDNEVIKYKLGIKKKNWESPSKNIEVKKSVSTESTNNYPSKQTTELKEEEKFILTKSTKHYPSKRSTKPKELEKFVSSEFIYPSKQPTKQIEIKKLKFSESTNNYPSEPIVITYKEKGKFVLSKSTKHYPSKQTTKLKEIKPFVLAESTNPSKQSSERKEEVLFVSTESANNYPSKQSTELKEVEKFVTTESANLSKQSTEMKVYGYKRTLPNIDQETSNKCNSNNSRLLKKNRSKNSELLKSEERLHKDKSKNKNVTENVNSYILESSFSNILQSDVKNVQESITHIEESIINESPDVKNVEGSNIGKIRVRDITTLMASSEPIKETPIKETSVLPLGVNNNKTNETLLEFKSQNQKFLSKPKIPKYILESFSRNDISFMKLYTLKFNELVDSKIEIMGGLLHMGITDHLCKQERLKWADKLLSEKSIYIEKHRIEKECRDTMRQRGIEFSALLGSIVNKFEDDCVKDMFFALYARLVETLLKIDAENEKHIFLSKNIIYNMLLKNNYTNQIVMGLFQGNNEVFKQSFSKFNSLIKFCNSFYTTEDGNIHKFNPDELECQQLTEGIFLNESKTLPVIYNCFIIQEGQKNVKNNLCMVKEATCSITTNASQQNDLFNNSSNDDSEVKDTSVPIVNQLEDCSDKVTDCFKNDLDLKLTEVISIKDSTELDHAYADKIQWIDIISDNSEKENNVHNFKIPEEIETIDITDNEEVNTDQNFQSIEISEGERNSTHDSVSSSKVRNVGVVYPMENNMLQTNTSYVVSSPRNTKVCATEQTNKINFTTLKKVIIKKDAIKQLVPVFPKVIKLNPIDYKLSPRFYKVHVLNKDGLDSSNVPQSLSFRKVSPYLDETDKQSDTIVPTITKSQLMGLQTNRKIILTDKDIQNDAQTIPSQPFMHHSNDEARKFFYFANNASSSNVNNTDLSPIQTPEVVIVYNNANSSD